MLIEIFKFIIYSILIVLISKYILVVTLRKLAENLNLKAKTVGNIAGIATSVPELLTITTSSLRGLYGTSIYNIISSNLINLIQYLGAIILNKNVKKIKNKAIKIDLALVILTIIIPIILLKYKIEININIVPGFIILYSLFKFLNNNTHNLFLRKEDKQIQEEIEKEVEKGKRHEKISKIKTYIYFLILILTGIMLFFIGELLGNTIENLCNIFNISEIIIGILLGFITSIPELITFFESQKHHKTNSDDMLGVVEATNNLLTSNILNLFIIQTIGILITNII